MALVQENTGNTGTAAASSYAVTLASGTTAGNTLLIVVSSDATVNTPTGFTLDQSQVNNNGHYVFRKAASAGETSWTVSPATSATGSWYVREESGLLSSPVDQVISTGIGTEVTTQSTGTTPTTAQAADFLFATIGTSKAFSGGALGTMSGWTNSFVEAAETGTTATSGTNVGVGVAVREVTATGAYETTATLSVLAAATGIMVAYKRGAAPARTLTDALGIIDAIGLTPNDAMGITDTQFGSTLSVEETLTDAVGTVDSIAFASPSVASAFPAVFIEVSFTTNPGATPVWVDVSAYVRGVSTSRGRQHELGRVETGVANIAFDNWDRRFDPDNVAGPYYPNVRPFRRIRIRAVWASISYDLFHGYVENWPRTYRDDFDAVVSVQATDGFKALNLSQVTGTFASALSGTRIGAILDAIGWPAADRDIDAGQSTMQASTLTAANPLEHLHLVADSELGLVYMSRDGKVTFLDRHSSFTAPLDTTTHTWGDTTGEKGYVDVAITYDDTDIWNEVKAQRAGGAEQSVSDATSIARYFKRTLSKSGLLLTTDTEVLDLANYMLTRFSEPALRITHIDLNGSMDTTQWEHLLHHDLGDKVRVKRRPPGGGAVVQQDSFIEGVGHNISFGSEQGVTWTTAWNLSPVDRSTNYWILDDPVYSILDTSTRVGI